MNEYPICIDCDTQFIVSDMERDFFKSKGLFVPRRCKNCRMKRKNRGEKAEGRYSVMCSVCLRETSVPFAPDADRPVFCLDCFAARKNEHSSTQAHE